MNSLFNGIRQMAVDVYLPPTCSGYCASNAISSIIIINISITISTTFTITIRGGKIRTFDNAHVAIVAHSLKHSSRLLATWSYSVYAKFV